MAPGPKPAAIKLSEQEQATLTELVRAGSTSQQLAQRSRVILKAGEGLNNEEVGRAVGLGVATVRLWRKRWSTTQGADRAGVAARLSDAYRRGTPPKFRAEQIVAIVAIGCTARTAHEGGASHWTMQEIAEEAVKRGIVERISKSQVHNFLKRGQSKAASQPLLA